jgi:membrane-bound lytic murein transglycosylase D
MRSRKAYFLIPLVAALILGTISCEPSEKKKPAVTVPAAAQAPTLTPPPPPPPKIEEKITSKPPDPVDSLIAQAEKEYQAGQANYAAGHLEAAKDNFDRAFDILLSGPVDVRSDDRLQQEFDKIVEGVHNLELQALKQGDGFTEQKAEPAPIDETNEITFPVDPNVRAKAEAEIKETHSDLPLVMNDQVASFVSYFSSRGHAVLERALARSGRYREMISRILKEEGVPQDLIYLAQAESGFHPLALSRAGARGMWQFMASRAAGYGLQRNWWVDERQDPEKSTRAAARHLKDLYNEFGDWYLAMAAYNSGPGTVQHAVQRTGYADFWQLYERGVLPKETKNYVPIIVAVTIMAKNPAQYGLDTVVPEEPNTGEKVTINYPVDLRLVAECIDLSVATLQELNPSLLRMTTPKDQPFDLILPAGTKEKFETAIAAIPPDMRVWWRYHKVGAGETLAEIARKYKTTGKAIAEVNSLEGDELRQDAKLIIPVTPGKRVESEGMTYAKKATRYKVRRGDTVLSVADDFGVPAARLRRWNGLKGNQLRAGRILLIHRPVAVSENPAQAHRTASKSKKSKQLDSTAKPDSTGSKVVHHTVRKGETLYSIASAYNTTVEALRRDNRKVAANLRAGDVLVIRER